MSLVNTRRKMQQMMKLIWAFVGIFIVGIFLSFNFAANQPSGRAVSSAAGGVLAKINGEEVPVQEFDNIVRQYRDMFGRPGVQQLSQIPKYAWEQILTSRAQSAAARANGVSVSSSDVGAEIDRQINERIKQAGQGATKEELENFRYAMRQVMPRDMVQRQLEAQRLQERLGQDARPVEVKVAHILVKTDKRSDAEARKLAEDYTRQAKTGADFAKLAREHSEDEGSKVKDGVVGWASAMPGGAAPAADKKKPAREPATNFVPEFTAAALRLKVNEVSNPVKSQFGYHVIKALETRDYEPPADTAAPAVPAVAAKKDPKTPANPAADAQKKRQEAIDSYRQAAGSAIAQGLFAEYKARATVEAVHPWLKGHLAEEKAAPSPTSAIQPGSKPEDQAAKMKPAIDAYTEALKAGGAWAGPGLAYKVAQLYQNANQPEQAVAVLEKEVRPYSDPELHFAYGEALMKLKTPRKTDALEAFQKSLKQSKSDTGLLGRLADKFKELGRNDLAEEARKKQVTVLAQQEKERKEYEEQQKKAAAAAAAPKKDDSVAEVTVKTGDIDPKTGKPKILSVTTTKPDDKKGEGTAAPAKDAKTPGAADKGTTKP